MVKFNLSRFTGKQILIGNLVTIQLILLGIAFKFYQDFGISFDEPSMRYHGLINAKYIADTFGLNLGNDLKSNSLYVNLPELHTPNYDARTHPAIFEVFLIFVEKVFSLTDNKKILWETRHLLTFIFSTSGFGLLFLYIYLRFKSYAYAYTCFVLLLISPRIFPDLFYNNKDSILSASYLISVLLTIFFLHKKTKILLIFSAFFLGISMSIRPVGIVVLIFLWFALLLNSDSPFGQRRINLKLFSAYTLISLFTLFLSQPYLWKNFLTGFSEIFVRAKKFSYLGCTLTNGVCMPNSDLPWNYLFIWIFTTIPVVFILFSILGVLFSFTKILKLKISKKTLSYEELDDLFILFCLFAPIIIAIGFNSTLYNGWRHFYFVYPLLVYFIIRFLHVVNFRFPPLITLFVHLILAFNIFATLNWMIINHPLQNLYFNQFAYKDINQKWESDYWFVSNKEALEFIVYNDKRDTIKIQTTSNSPLYDSSDLLDQNLSSRLMFLSFSEGLTKADYVIVNQSKTSVSKIMASFVRSQSSHFKQVYSRKIGNLQVYSIYKRIT